MTIQPTPGRSHRRHGPVTWTFEVVPQTNLQSFRTTIRSQNAWLPITTTSTSAMIRRTSRPRAISTQGEYRSRGDAAGRC